MNAAQENTPTPLFTPADESARSLLRSRSLEAEARASGWSALVDGEVSAQELGRLLADDAAQDETLATWHAYQVTGAVLRGNAALQSTPAAQRFLAGFRERLQAEQPLAVRPPPPRQTALPAALARAPATAANDAVFRWKLVSGLTSLVAVLAVSWTALATAPGSGAGAGAQLALLDAQTTVATSTQEPALAAVLVQTVQGAVIRDPQIEVLLAQHRQHAGMSALQVPAGFLRNATFDPSER